MCFHIANLQIKSECGTHSADKKAQKLSFALNPHFANTMLAEGIYFNFC